MNVLQALGDAFAALPRWVFAAVETFPGWIAVAVVAVLLVAWRIRVAARKLDRIIRERTAPETPVIGDVAIPSPVTDHDGS